MSYIKKIIDTYDKKYLIPRLGQGSVRQELLSGLEDVLQQIPLPIDTKKTPLNHPALDRPIDYDLLYKRNNTTNTFSRIKNMLARECLKRGGIKTYKDLLEFFETNSDKIYTKNYVRMLDIRGFGDQTSRCLYSFLNSLGINIFKGGYSRAEISYF